MGAQDPRWRALDLRRHELAKHAESSARVRGTRVPANRISRDLESLREERHISVRGCPSTQCPLGPVGTRNGSPESTRSRKTRKLKSFPRVHERFASRLSRQKR